MAKKRIVRTYTDTSASGDRTPIEGNRYFLRVNLVSLKSEEKGDFMGKTSEYYFKVGGKGIFNLSQRTPNVGTINLEVNEVFKPTDGLTLYCGFFEKEGGDTIELPFKIYEEDMGKDDLLLNTTLTISLGQSREFLAFQEGGVKVKISVSANRTRY